MHMAALGNEEISHGAWAALQARGPSVLAIFPLLLVRRGPSCNTTLRKWSRQWSGMFMSDTGWALTVDPNPGPMVGQLSSRGFCTPSGRQFFCSGISGGAPVSLRQILTRGTAFRLCADRIEDAREHDVISDGEQQGHKLLRIELLGQPRP